MGSRDIVRPLGCLEIFSSSRHALAAYTCVANTCRYVRPVQDAAAPFAARLETALAKVVADLGSLRIGIAGETTGKPCFVRIDSVDLRDHIRWRTVDGDAGLLRLIEDQHDRLWPDIERRPPWTVIVVEGPAGLVAVDIVFAVHHALCDGKSTAVFHRHLLRALSAGPGPPPPGLDGHVLDLSGRKPVVPPSLEAMVKFDISWPFFLWTLWSDMAPSWLRPSRAAPPWTGRVITMEPRRVNIRLITVPQASVAPLLAACRAEGTTLTGLLHALVLASLSRRVPADIAATFQSDTPISLLPYARLPPGVDLDLEDVLSNLNTAVSHTYDVETIARFRGRAPQNRGADAPDVWNVARAVRVTLKTRVAAMPKDDILGLLPWVADWNKRWLSKIGKPRDGTWSVSNIGSMCGTCPDAADGAGSSWTLDRSFFSQPSKLFGPAIDLNVAGIEGGAISITVTWQESIVNTSVMEGLVRDVDDWLTALGRTGQS